MRAVVVGGTGMLGGLVDALVARGDDVVVPSRHPAPGEDRTAVSADWTDPDALVAAVHGHAPFDLAVIWCHRPYREPLTQALRPLLSPDAQVVQVLGATSLTHLWDERPTPDVVYVMLGERQLDDGTSRWLTHAEISDGVLGATTAEPGSTVVVGSLD